MNPYQHSFSEALDAAKRGKTIRRSLWSNEEFMIRAVFKALPTAEDRAVALVTSSDPAPVRFWTPGTADLFANDWGIF